MQFPAKNAHPFEFARLILLLTGLSFVLGFGGYVALSPGKVALARDNWQPASAATPASVVSAPRADDWNISKKI